MSLRRSGIGGQDPGSNPGSSTIKIKELERSLLLNIINLAHLGMESIHLT
jgi:hypothetical protein